MAEDRGGRRPGEVLFEFTQLGGQMRVAAIDAATSTEVVIIAPLTATRIQMQNIALAKLRRRLGEGGNVREPGLAEAAPRPGKTVIKSA